MLSYKLVALGIITCALVSSCNTLDTPQSTQAEIQELNIHKGILHTAQGNIQEICPQLRKGQVLNFSFSSNLTTLFNLHYHNDEDVSYPVKKHLTASYKHSFKAPFDQTYCLMWRAIQDKTEIKYEYSISQ